MARNAGSRFPAAVARRAAPPTAGGGAGAAPTTCRMCGSPEVAAAGTIRGYGFAECRRCGFVFCPAIGRDDADRQYGRRIPEDTPVQGWADAAFLEPALARLRGRGSLAILDFGVGESVVPDLLRGQGHRVVAVDVAPPRRPTSDRLTGDLLALRLAARSFDLAYAFQVFEHLPHPRPYLFELLRLTKPGGLTVVHTDMETPERADGLESWWYVLPPEHCSFFRPRTIATALAGTPHRLVEASEKMAVIEAAG